MDCCADTQVPGPGDDLADEARHDKSFQHTVNGKAPCDPNADLLTLQGTIGALMHELEAILHEYLSFNWDRIQEVNKANAHLQREAGLMCPWRPSGDHEGSQVCHDVFLMCSRTCEVHQFDDVHRGCLAAVLISCMQQSNC